MYKSTYDGSMIDLDDTSIYDDKWKEMTTLHLWDEGIKKAGHSLFYMEYIYPDMKEGSQFVRVDDLCKELIILWKIISEDTEKNRYILMKWLYRFEDEVENQC